MIRSKRSIARGLAFLLPIVLLLGCGEPSGSEPGEIFGHVLELGDDGRPVSNVMLSLSPSGKTSITGSDGYYRFNSVDPGTYSISYSAQGYINGEDQNIIVGPGKSIEHPIHIELGINNLQVQPEELDFGSNPQITTLSINIQNKYSHSLTYEITNNCGWITTVKPDRGTLEYKGVASIIVVVDWGLMPIGENVTTLVLNVPTIGSRPILVKANKVADKVPALNALDVTEVHATSAVLRGQIIEDGIPKYFKRGFIYSELSAPTPENSTVVTAIVSDDKEYSVGVDGLSLGKSYYVKAFAENSAGIAYSSNTVKFITVSTAPVVETLQPTNIDEENSSVVFRGNVIDAGDPSYTEIGFAYSNVYGNPTVDDNKLVVSGQTGTGVFEKRIILTGSLYDYYVRAYVINSKGITYGEPVKVSPEGYLVLSSANLQVEKNDVGMGNWFSMKTLCENRTTGDMTGWRLPTKDELATLYSLRNEIGGFNLSNGESGSNTWPAHYWSATFAVNLGYYYINFETGSLGDAGDVASYKRSARCVRSLNHD